MSASELSISVIKEVKSTVDLESEAKLTIIGIKPRLAGWSIVTIAALL